MAEHRHINIFLIISFACTGLFLLLLIATKGEAAQWLVMENNFDYTFTGWQADLFVFLPIYIIMGYSFIEDWRAK